ncbi:MAG: hypothetical protein KJ025_21160 [Burkholderiales bacterium]|nr:hypothetical protein [Burkholderiales bacterium]
MRRRSVIASLAVLLGVAGCATVPTGPSVLVLPGSSKSFEEFRADEQACRQYAHEQIGGATAQQAATESAVRSAAVGTAIGAAAGALIGGRDGAAVGAGTGLIFGSAAGAGYADYSGASAQQRYDHAYQQCMYLKGNKVPVAGVVQSRRRGHVYPPPPDAPPPSGTYYPPPPPGR